MPITTATLSESILFRDQQKTLELLEPVIREWAMRAERQERLNDETASLLSQIVRICLRSPDQMRDLWEWAKAEELAGRLRDLQQAGDDLRERLEVWLHFLALIQEAAKRAEAEGYPVSDSDKLEPAGDELRAILQDVKETWPPQEPGAIPPLSYEELRSLADRFPPPAQWIEEEDDFF